MTFLDTLEKDFQASFGAIREGQDIIQSTTHSLSVTLPKGYALSATKSVNICRYVVIIKEW